MSLKKKKETKHFSIIQNYVLLTVVDFYKNFFL